jgi:hypothetical protein
MAGSPSQRGGDEGRYRPAAETLQGSLESNKKSVFLSENKKIRTLL